MLTIHTFLRSSLKAASFLALAATLAPGAHAEDKMVVCDPVSFATITSGGSWDISMSVTKDIILQPDNDQVPLGNGCTMFVSKSTVLRTLKARKLALKQISSAGSYGMNFVVKDPTVEYISCESNVYVGGITFREIRGKLNNPQLGFSVPASSDARCVTPVDALRLTDQRERDERLATKQSDGDDAKDSGSGEGDRSKTPEALKKHSI